MNNLGQANLRRGRYSSTNYVYHITSVTRGRERIFSSFNLSRQLIGCMRNSDDQGFTYTKVFCVMPDHLHWMFELRSGNLSQVVARMKSSFSGLSGLKIWQDGFHDHAIRSEESLINVARYIVANPLRAGLVEKVGNYPHWDSIWLE